MIMAVSKKKKKIILPKKRVLKKKTKIAAKKPVLRGRAIKKNAKKVVKRKVAVRKSVKKKIAKKQSPLELKRAWHNPIIKPEGNVYWESKAAFNPSALYHDGKIHIIYRAIGDSDVSVLGYASSSDGYFFDKKSKELAYYSKNKQAVKKDSATKLVNYSSGGGWGGGSEDPRLTLIGDTVYMIYTAFDGWGSLRMALTSISLEDFLKRRWHWEEPVLISPPGEVHKNWVLFPEKINGKFAILHSISPKILIEYVDKIEHFDGTKFIHSIHQDSPEWRLREKGMRGVGPTPLRTKHGWLVFYHMDKKGSQYKIWAMILDTKDPTKILYRSKEPILEPEEWYENEGYKSGVVYSCGAIVKPSSTGKGKELFVYYGGADKVSCVATADLNKFLEELVRSGKTRSKSKNK